MSNYDTEFVLAKPTAYYIDEQFGSDEVCLGVAIPNRVYAGVSNASNMIIKKLLNWGVVRDGTRRDNEVNKMLTISPGALHELGPKKRLGVRAVNAFLGAVARFSESEQWPTLPIQPVYLEKYWVGDEESRAALGFGAQVRNPAAKSHAPGVNTARQQKADRIINTFDAYLRYGAPKLPAQAADTGRFATSIGSKAIGIRHLPPGGSPDFELKGEFKQATDYATLGLTTKEPLYHPELPLVLLVAATAIANT